MRKKISVDVQSLIDAQDKPFVLIDKEYNVVAANKAYQQTYGVSEQAIVGRKCYQVSHHSEVPCHLNGEDCPHKQVFETRQPHQVLHVHYDSHAQSEYVRIKGFPILGPGNSIYLGEAIFPLAHSADLDCAHQCLIGHSTAFQACIECLTVAGKSDTPVLLSGARGVGKDLAAEYIHRRSARNGHPFSTIDCQTIAESAFESELFGHERSAFTGCIGRRIGMFEQADGGTLFFNEIGELPYKLQGHLLRAMETGQFRRVGGRELLSTDTRIVCSSSNNLRQLVANNEFRSDLYYRIAGIVCEIPALHQRRTDIPELAHTLLQRMGNGEDYGYHLTDDAIEILLGHDYPGNMRELRNILQRAASLSSNGIITAREIRIEEPMTPKNAENNLRITDQEGQEPSIKGLESQYIAELLDEHHGKRAKVAQILGISERTLYRKLKQYGLQSIGRTD